MLFDISPVLFLKYEWRYQWLSTVLNSVGRLFTDFDDGIPTPPYIRNVFHLQDESHRL